MMHPPANPINNEAFVTVTSLIGALSCADGLVVGSEKTGLHSNASHDNDEIREFGIWLNVTVRKWST